MKSKVALLAVTAAGLVTGISPAFAQEQSYFDRRVEAPRNALELTVGTGYTQGFGLVSRDTSVPDLASAGIGAEVGVGWRMIPQLSLAVTGQYQELNAERGNGSRGMTAGVNATYHMKPYLRIDPWVQLGVGYRLLWETNTSPTPDVLRHGFQLARAQVGLDFHTMPEVAIGPVIGADLNMFLWQKPADGSTFAVGDPRLNTFVFAGLQGRFDIGGTAEPAMRQVARR